MRLNLAINFGFERKRIYSLQFTIVSLIIYERGGRVEYFKIKAYL